MSADKPIKGSKEIRALGKVEMRAVGEGAAKKIGGYAAPFNSPTEIAGRFIEKIAPGAFTATIARDDIRALFNHNSDYVLGRNTNKTLTLSEDAKGLVFEVTPPDTSWARDVMASVERSDIDGMSFGFEALREEWDDTGDMPVRTLLEVELFEVSLCVFPAYQDTTCAMRSLESTRSAKKQAEDAAAAEAVKRAAEKAAADAAAAEVDRLAAIGAAPVIGARMRMKHAIRGRGVEGRAAMPKDKMPDKPMKPDMTDMEKTMDGMMQKMAEDMQKMMSDMKDEMDKMMSDMKEKMKKMSSGM